MIRAEATKFVITDTKFASAVQKFGEARQKFGRPKQKFRSTNPKFCCLNPSQFLIGLTKNEGQLDQKLCQPNQIAIWLFQPSKKVEIAYKISMSVQKCCF